MPFEACTVESIRPAYRIRSAHLEIQFYLLHILQRQRGFYRSVVWSFIVIGEVPNLNDYLRGAGDFAFSVCEEYEIENAVESQVMGFNEACGPQPPKHPTDGHISQALLVIIFGVLRVKVEVEIIVPHSDNG
jgi:hypothetical protein